MGDFFVGEIRLFTFPYAPQYWAQCDGTVLQVQQNAALYSLIGFTYGGNGSTAFNLPDMRGRLAVGQTTSPANLPPGVSSTYVMAAGKNTGGASTVTLAASNLPLHTHQIAVNNAPGSTTSFKATYIAGAPAGVQTFAAPGTLQALDASTVTSFGAGGAHSNMQPSLALNYCIAVSGLYPPRP